MRTRFVYNFGTKKNVQEYIVDLVQRLRRSEDVRDTAIKMSYHLAKNTSFLGLYPSMRAMTLVNLAAIERGEDIRSRRWSDLGLCAYKTLLKHSKEFKGVLEKSDDFPNLKYHIIGYER